MFRRRANDDDAPESSTEPLPPPSDAPREAEAAAPVAVVPSGEGFRDDAAAEQFESHVRRCLHFLNELNVQTTLTLEAQDAEIRTLQQANAHSPNANAGQQKGVFRVPTLRLGHVGNAHLAPSPRASLDNQLDSLLDRVHLLLDNRGSFCLTSRTTTAQEGGGGDTRRLASEQSADTGGNNTHTQDTLKRFPMRQSVDMTHMNRFPPPHVGGKLERISSSAKMTTHEEIIAGLEVEVSRLKHELNVFRHPDDVGVAAATNSSSPLPHVVAPPYDDRDDETMTNAGIGSRMRRQVSVEEAKIKIRCLEEMQQGSWFFRVGRKFGALGKALKTTYRKRAFVWISCDFSILYCAANQPPPPAGLAGREENDGGGGGGRRTRGGGSKDLVLALPLDNVIGFVYGDESRAYRLQDGRSDHLPAHLCFSLWTKRQTMDLISLNEQEVDRWYLGLNALIPFFPGRNFMTTSEFVRKKDSLRMQFYRNERQRRSLEPEDGGHWASPSSCAPTMPGCTRSSSTIADPAFGPNNAFQS